MYIQFDAADMSWAEKCHPVEHFNVNNRLSNRCVCIYRLYKRYGDSFLQKADIKDKDQ